jgi:hypothetical protein
MAVDGRPSGSDVDVDDWKQREFPAGSRARATFEYLCLLGCDPRGLLSFLTVVTAVSSKEQQSIYDVYGVSKSALVKLPTKLEKISRELEAVDRLFGDYTSARFVENPNHSDQARSRWRQQAAVYQKTPELLRVLATDLRVASEFIDECAGPKRFDFFRYMVRTLIEYVESCTKSPHYQQVADLLDHLHSTDQKLPQNVAKQTSKPARSETRKKNSAPKLLTSADALKALYHRSAKYGFRKGRRSKSELPPSA